ncbi:FliI/YscN family ATPase [Spirochaeta cellobiosiphila]|uniref:FliI/YscN family ATPase n=1 Tax=Spirochaeta cellobiosiphila TaxID=504483 RepID=UPI0005690406|nr:FliI/YscN family ATPase [Spirochaeta cellobiosiphila]
MFSKYESVIEKMDSIKFKGRVTKVQGLMIESKGPQAVVGELCQIDVPKGAGSVWAEVVGFNAETVQLMTYSEMDGLEIGCEVTAMGESLNIYVSDKLLGRVLNPLGQPIDGLGDVGSQIKYPSIASPPDMLNRKSIKEQMVTGIRSIDGFLPIGKGQRMGIFAGSGVGKSTLLGMIARNTKADINVIALIGERGREVREFIENDLGEEGLERSIIIVSSSDTPPLARLRGAYTATAIAEYFRDQGNDVMLLFDSVTRFARAQREIGLAIGEPPATRGYTPSVFSTLPKLLERCGTNDKGTITGFYTILVDGDDMDEPIADTVRGILDGHIVLSRKLASEYHYPAIDVMNSVSRLQSKITSKNIQNIFGVLRQNLALYEKNEDLISIGAYTKGSNPSVDKAIEKNTLINDFLRQDVYEKIVMYQTLSEAASIADIPLTDEDKSKWVVSDNEKI